MNKLKTGSLILLSVWLMSVSAGAGDFDGSKELICSAMDIVECLPGGKCMEVTAEQVGIPYFLRINFKNKKVSATHADGSQKNSAIKNIEKIDNKVIIQGAEDGIKDVRDGVGWSAAISEDSGKMVITAAGDDVGFVIFGACTVP